MPTSFVEGMHLLGSQVDRDLPQSSNDLVDEGLVLSSLQSYKVALALVSDFDECIASHVLDTYTESVRIIERGFRSGSYPRESHA